MSVALDRRRVCGGWRWPSVCVAMLALLACSTSPASRDGEPDGASRDGRERTSSDDAGLALELELQRSADGASRLRVAVRNLRDVTISFDATNTPFETPLSADLFDVRRGGEPVDYLGRVVKRAGGGAANAVELAPDEALVALIDLGAYYALTPGERHTVSPRRVVLDGVVRLAGLPDVSVRPSDGIAFAP